MEDELAEIRRRKMSEMMRRMATPRVEEPLANGRVNILTDSTFWSTISQTKTAIVDFFGEWCAPCRSLAPIMDELAREWQGRVFFGKVDIDRNPRTTMEFGIQSVPMVVPFRLGKPLALMPGLRSYNEYELVLARITEKHPGSGSDPASSPNYFQ